MDKIKEIGIKPLAIAVAVLALLAGVLGIANVGVGAIICGILAAAAAVLIMLVFGGGGTGSANKSDKYKKLFMNLPIGFAQAKIVNDPVNGTSYEIVDANEIFGEYFKLDVSDYKDKILKESKIEVLQDINAWFTAYNNSGTKEGDLMDVEITMESLQKVFNTVMYKSEADYINMVVIDVTKQKETEEKLSKAIVDANAAYKTQAEFLANMSHEIRTPINGILGMLQLTLMAEDLQADYRDNLITAKNCADTLLRLINEAPIRIKCRREKVIKDVQVSTGAILRSSTRYFTDESQYIEADDRFDGKTVLQVEEYTNQLGKTEGFESYV